MEGIVLKSTPFEDSGRILTLYTEKEGLLNLIVRKVGQKDFSLRNILSVLSLSEFHIHKGSGDLFRLQDASLVDCFLEIRNQLEKLTLAGGMLRQVAKMQLPLKPSPLLFKLLKAYLIHMKSSTNPAPLYFSFSLKHLLHEGLFPHERELSPIPLTIEEWDLVLTLCSAKHFTSLSPLQIPETLKDKLNEFIDLCT